MAQGIPVETFQDRDRQLRQLFFLSKQNWRINMTQEINMIKIVWVELNIPGHQLFYCQLVLANPGNSH